MSRGTWKLLAVACLVSACGGDDTIPTAAYSDPGGQFSFRYPSDWTVETVPEMNGVLLLAPDQEHDWQANMFFELRHDFLSRSLEQAMSDLVPELESRKAGFKLQAASVIKLDARLDAGRIEYSHTEEGTGLLGWEVLVPAGGETVLFVTASTAKAGTGKYQPVFSAVLDSIELK